MSKAFEKKYLKNILSFVNLLFYAICSPLLCALPPIQYSEVNSPVVYCTKQNMVNCEKLESPVLD